MDQYRSQYQQVYESLLNNRNLLSLYQFHHHRKTQLYPTTNQYPQFFNHNLVSPARVIKLFKGPNAVIQSFYFQLMKLCFQIEMEKDYIEILKSIIFNPLIYIKDQSSSSPKSGNQYSDDQYKKFLAQFMEYLMTQSIPNFQQALNTYPIINEALQKTFQKLSLKNSCAYQILTNLSEIFEITLTNYGKCYKFQQTDIFLYEENQNQFYMAYMNQMGEQYEDSQQEENQENYQKEQANIVHYEQEQNQQQLEPANNNSQLKQYLTQNQNIQNKNTQQTITNNKKYNTNNQASMHINNQNSIKTQNNKNRDDIIHNEKEQQQFSDDDQENQNVKEQNCENQDNNRQKQEFMRLAQDKDNVIQKKQIEQQITHKQSQRIQAIAQQPKQQQNVQSYQVHNQSPYKINYSNQYQINNYLPQQPAYNSIQAKNTQKYQQQLIYRPKNYMLNTIQQMSISRQFTNPNAFKYNNIYQKYNSDDDSKGTLYRQFTNTKILQLITEPQKTKIKLMKNRYIGVRNKNKLI